MRQAINERGQTPAGSTGEHLPSAVFTLRLNEGRSLFVHHGVVGVFTDILERVAEKENCIVPVYCFMPDHQYLIMSGMRHDSDMRRAVRMYKQRTGIWMSRNIPSVKWQKGFEDLVIAGSTALSEKTKKILNGPVSCDMVSSWKEYPFKGSIGCRLEDILNCHRTSTYQDKIK